jgi:hypothetical protein
MKKGLILTITVVISCLFPLTSLADDAMMLPEGYFRARVKPMHFWNDEQWDHHGDAEKIHDDYNVLLNRDVFADVGELEDGLNDMAGEVGLETLDYGFLNIGTTEIKMNSVTWIMGTALEYGITDKIALGIIVPVITMHNYVSARVVGGNLGWNPAANEELPIFAAVGAPTDSLSPEFVPLLPTQDQHDLSTVSLGGAAVPTGIVQPDTVIGTEGLQQILQQQYNYKRFRSWHSGWGLGDVEIGYKHQVFDNKAWRVAYQAGFRAPTGRTDDPDDLNDYYFGDGQWDLGAYLMVDWVPSRYFWINLTNRYTVQFPDHITLRVPDDPDMPITPNREHVARDMGDYYELEIEPQFEIMPDFFIMRGKYNFRYKAQDKIEGSKGFNYESLMSRSLQREHVIEFGFNIKTIQAFVDNEFPLPMEFGGFYMKSVAGLNTYKWDGVGLEVKFYFGPVYAFGEPEAEVAAAPAPAVIDDNVPAAAAPEAEAPVPAPPEIVE